jgi:hypothetical protein
MMMMTTGEESNKPGLLKHGPEKGLRERMKPSERGECGVVGFDEE